MLDPILTDTKLANDLVARLINEHTQTDEVCFVSTETQTDRTASETRSKYDFSPLVYEADIQLKETEIENLKKEIEKLIAQPFGFCRLANSDELCEHYTGVSLRVFDLLVQLCKLIPIVYYKNQQVTRLPFKDQVLMTLMKLRLNCTYLDLGVRFGVSASTAHNIVYAVLPILHKIVFQSIMDKMPSRKKSACSLPSAFESYRSCRVIIDATEFKCEIPHNMQEQKMTYSPYKKSTTLKTVVGVAPNGTIIHCSDAYPGSTSDKEIVKNSGLLEELEPGDLILADKGFLIHDILPAGVSLNIPPFLNTPQFTHSEVEQTQNIAKARIHIERANARLKRYRILSFIPKTLYTRASMVVQTCCGLVNFQNPLIRSMEKHFILQEETTESAEEIEYE